MKSDTTTETRQDSHPCRTSFILNIATLAKSSASCYTIPCGACGKGTCMIETICSIVNAVCQLVLASATVAAAIAAWKTYHKDK